MNQRSYQDCYNTAIRLLARRDHSCKELERKLRQRQYDKIAIQSTISECRRFNYLDDEKFADLYTGQLQRRGYGPRRIQQMLAAKGVARHLVSEAVRINCPESKEFANCRHVLEKKIRSLQSIPHQKNLKERLHRFLSSRGFSPAIIRKTLSDILS